MKSTFIDRFENFYNGIWFMKGFSVTFKKKCIDFYFVLAYILPLFWLIEYYFYVFVSFVVFCSHRNAKINYVNYNKTMLTCNLFMSASKIIVMAYKRYQSLSKITVWYRNGEICLLTSCMTSWIQNALCVCQHVVNMFLFMSKMHMLACDLFNVHFSVMWRCYHYRWKAAKFELWSALIDHWAVRVLLHVLWPDNIVLCTLQVKY